MAQNIKGKKFKVLPPINVGGQAVSMEESSENKVPTHSSTSSKKSPRRLNKRSDESHGFAASHEVATIEEDLRMLAIGSPAPCGSHHEDFDVDCNERDATLHDGTPFPAITVDKCDEEVSNITIDSESDQEETLSTKASQEDADLRWTPRKPQSRLNRRSVSIQESLYRRGSPSASPVSGLLSPTPAMYHNSIEVLVSRDGSIATSRSESDLATPFKLKGKHRQKLAIDVERPPAPWKSHPGTPVSPRTSLSLLSTPQKSTPSSPVSPRRPIRLVPLSYPTESSEENN